MFICVVGTIGYINKVNISNVQDIEFLHCAKNLHVVFNTDQKYTEKDQLWQKQNKNKTNTALVKHQPSGSMAQQLHRHTLPRGGHQDCHVDSTPITQPICVPPHKVGGG